MCSLLLIALPSWQECGSQGAASLSLVKRRSDAKVSLHAPLQMDIDSFSATRQIRRAGVLVTCGNYKRFELTY